MAAEQASPEEFVQAISDDDFAEAVDSIDYTGADEQLAVYTDPIQEFPTEGDSYGVITTGRATEVAGNATGFLTTDLGGPQREFPEGPGFDVATLSIRFTVPETAQAVNFDFQYGTEENPAYLGNEFQDLFFARLTGPDGYEENISVLPSGERLTVDSAANFSNAPGGSSAAPEPPFPDPDDVKLNAVTSLLAAQNAQSFEDLDLRGEQLTLEIVVSDISDAILDTGLLIDNLTFGEPTGAAQPSVSLLDQESDGSTVVVLDATIPQGGFIAIHETNEDGSPGAVIGHTEFLEPGTSSNVNVSLDEPIESDQSLIAMLHQDTNDNETYDFPDADGPYTNEAGAVVDDAQITVTADQAGLVFDDQSSDGAVVEVSTVTMPEGGFVVIASEDGETVYGVSQYLTPGSYQSLAIDLDTPLPGDGTFLAAAQADLNGNQQFDSASVLDSCELDVDGNPLLDTATIDVEQDDD